MKAAKDGPWEVSTDYDCTGYPTFAICGLSGEVKSDTCLHESNAALIENAPTDIAALIEALEAAEKKQHKIWDALKSQTKRMVQVDEDNKKLQTDFADLVIELVEAKSVIDKMDFQTGCSWCEKNSEIRNKHESE